MSSVEKSRLTLIAKTKSWPNPRALYRCECGKTKEIQIANVNSGHTKSCGCLYSETRYGNKKHGFRNHLLYDTWSNIKGRCHDKKHGDYRIYGARGVVMCDEWFRNPEKFITWALENGWKKGLQVDKDIKAKELGVEPLIYSPERCSIVTGKINCNTTRRSRYIEFNGKKQTLSMWSEELGIPSMTLSARIGKLNWPLAKAFTTPIRGTF